MQSILQPAENAALVKRIQSLRADAKATWGKMDAAQMLAHCHTAMRVCTGDLKLKRSLIGVLFGGLAKKSLTKPEPFKRNLPTAPEFVVRDRRDFTQEQRKLLELVQDIGRRGSSAFTREKHPFFGPMTDEEWDLLQWKHVDHHLRQFGA
jgi:hypothetical protein